MQTKVMFSSEETDWETPDLIFDPLARIYSFNLDPCATAKNAKCKKYFTKKDNGLAQSWQGYRVFMNPPYGNPENPCHVEVTGRKCKKKKCRERGRCTKVYIPGIINWVRKARLESEMGGCLVMGLIPGRTDTEWWHQNVEGKAFTQNLPGRQKFGNAKNCAPFPSVLALWSKLKWGSTTDDESEGSDE